MLQPTCADMRTPPSLQASVNHVGHTRLTSSSNSSVLFCTQQAGQMPISPCFSKIDRYLAYPRLLISYTRSCWAHLASVLQAMSYPTLATSSQQSSSSSCCLSS
jgi:hypothetical protein